MFFMDIDLASKLRMLAPVKQTKGGYNEQRKARSNRQRVYTMSTINRYS